MSYNERITTRPTNVDRYVREELKIEEEIPETPVIPTSSVSIDDYMSSGLTLEGGLAPEEKKLLVDFQNLSEQEDYIFLWSCAQMAADRMTVANQEIALTPYGVTEVSYLNKTVTMTEDEELETKRRIFSHNRMFLQLWDAKVQEMKGQRDRINALTEETRMLLNKNVIAMVAIKRVVNLMIEQGFTPTNPEVVETKPSDVMENGVHIHAENELKEVREAWLFLPGNRSNVHVTTRNGLICERVLRAFAKQVAEVLEGISGASIPVSTKIDGHKPDGGSGTNNLRKKSHAHLGKRQAAKAKI